jgi:hypothetical protein
MSSVPFDIRIDSAQRRVTLVGDLDGTEKIAQLLEKYCEKISQFGDTWIVDASLAQIAKGGIDCWINAVQLHLMGVGLTYEWSQLAHILQCLDDNTYRHQHSLYEDPRNVVQVIAIPLRLESALQLAASEREKAKKPIVLVGHYNDQKISLEIQEGSKKRSALHLIGIKMLGTIKYGELEIELASDGYALADTESLKGVLDGTTPVELRLRQ